MASKEEVQAHFEEWLDELSMDDHKIVFQRACVAARVPHSLNEETGAVRYEHDLEDPTFQLAMHNEYVRMYWGEAIEELESEGKIVATGVGADGEINYTKVAA